MFKVGFAGTNITSYDVCRGDSMTNMQLQLLDKHIDVPELRETLNANGETQFVEIERLNQNHWVTKHNDLIESTYKLTLQQQRILLIIASRVQPSDDSLKLYRINTKDVIGILGLKSVSNYYNQIKDIVNGLQKETLTIKNNNRETNFNWVITSDYVPQQGYFQIQLHPGLQPYFLELKEKFTKYRLENVLKLNSSYSIRIYELLKQYEGLGSRTFEVDELKFLLSINPSQYKQYSHLKDRVIKPSQLELMEFTDICFDYTEIKTGRKITKLKFTIKPNYKKPKEVISSTSEDKIEKDLLEFGLTKRQIANVRKKYDESDIVANIEYTNERMFLSTVKRPGAYFMMAIKENYAGEKPMFTNTKTSESNETKLSLKVNQEKYEMDHFGRTPEEFETFLLSAMNLMSEEIALESGYAQLKEYLKYQEETTGYLIPLSKFTDTRIQSLYKRIIIEM